MGLLVIAACAGFVALCGWTIHLVLNVIDNLKEWLE